MAICESNINVPEKTIEISSEEKKKNRCQIFKELLNSGLDGMTPQVAAAICGNIFRESGYNPNAVNPSSKAYGICQWLGDRKTNLKKKAGQTNKSVSDLGLQINFLIDELNGKEKNAWNQVKGSTDIGRTTKTFCNGFERPGKKDCNDTYQIRFDAARKAYEACVENKDVSLV